MERSAFPDTTRNRDPQRQAHANDIGGDTSGVWSNMLVLTLPQWQVESCSTENESMANPVEFGRICLCLRGRRFQGKTFLLHYLS